MLNDNLDGTFKFLGYYDDRRGLGPGNGFVIDPPSLPIVVQVSAANAPTREASSIDEIAAGGPEAHTGEDEDQSSAKVSSSLSSQPSVTPVEPPSLSTRQPCGPSALRPRGRPPKALPEPQLETSSTGHLPMEDWELAPGRIRSTAPRPDSETGPAQNIAFSKAYLTANQSVKVSADASFRMDIVTSGNSLQWKAKEDVLRICSVGAGKIRVRILEEEEFNLGPHGMFRLVPGKSCVVTNKLYGDALLHVCEFPE